MTTRDTTRIHVRPAEGLNYRDPKTLRLVPAEGYDADPNDFNVVRALACGDLIKTNKGHKGKHKAPDEFPDAEAASS